MKSLAASLALIIVGLPGRSQTGSQLISRCDCAYTIKIGYPQSAARDSVEGDVVVQFKVDKNCMLHDPTVKKGLRYDCDDAALKAAKGMMESYNRCHLKCSCTSTDTVRIQTFSFRLDPPY
jgi:TonB family protein